MIDNYDWIIYLSDEWNRYFRSHLIYELSRQLPDSRILCVARPLCLLSGPLHRPRRFLAWLKQPSRVTTLDKNLFLFRPWIYLHDHVADKLTVVQKQNMYSIRKQLLLIINQLNFRKNHLIGWVSDPFQEEYIGILNERISIYECYDEYTSWYKVPYFRTAKELQAREERILRRANITFVVSEALYESKRDISKNIHIVHNGVDFTHLSSVNDERTPIAEDMTNISKPVIGYIGNLTDRVDFRIIYNLVINRPEWSFILIAPPPYSYEIKKSRRFINKLKQSSNVYFLGFKTFEVLPQYLKAFDVCLLPYRVDDPFNINCSPLKLYEYLSTGKPIVSTDIPAVRPFDGLVRIAQDTEEFEQQVAEAIEDQDNDLSKQRLVTAMEHSWEHRAEQIITLVEKSL